MVEGSQSGNVAVYGGTVTNEMAIDISAKGGTAGSNADGGDGRIAVGGGDGIIEDDGDAMTGSTGAAGVSTRSLSAGVARIPAGAGTGRALRALPNPGSSSSPRSSPRGWLGCQSACRRRTVAPRR